MLPGRLVLEPTNVPLPIVVPPEKVFAPDKVSVPVPVLTRPPVPLITPENVVEAFVPPLVSANDPRSMLPAPAMEPTVSAAAVSCRVAADDTLTAVVSASELLPASASVPAETFVAPV